MVNQIKAIIWDMGGVLLRTNGEESRRELAKEFQCFSGCSVQIGF